MSDQDTSDEEAVMHDGFGRGSVYQNNDEGEADHLFDGSISMIHDENSFHIEDPNHSTATSSWQFVSCLREGGGPQSPSSSHSPVTQVAIQQSVDSWVAYSSERIRMMDMYSDKSLHIPAFDHPVLNSFENMFIGRLPAVHDRHVNSRLFPTAVVTNTAHVDTEACTNVSKRQYEPSTWRNIAQRINKASWQELEDADRDAAMCKWRGILQSSPQSSKLGRAILADILTFKSDDEFMQSLKDTLAMKATKTLHKRANSIIRFMAWCNQKSISPFPVMEPTVYAFLHDCAWQSPGFGASFREALNGGTLGTDGALESASSPWVSGFCARSLLTHKKKEVRQKY